ncbi:MAG: phosphoribosylanthranilate isomerase [Pseudomonadota bacterium]
MTQIKLCCVQSVLEADAALRRGVDAVGLVGPMPFRDRQIPDEEIATIAGQVSRDVTTVLLTAETSVEGVCAHLERVGTNGIQLANRVEPGVIPALRLLHPTVTIFQVVHIHGARSVEEALASKADHILLDSGKLDVTIPSVGVTGRTHDWAISAEIVARADRPVWLAGGLTPDNVARAIAVVRPYGVDVCSGLRTEHGLDLTLLDAFIEAVAEAA